ncbi:sulfurtransferase TusA [Gammaproteobacteria bacterium]|nr:sulfurtransferase TusA [Gammaproteobacteria bacterium]
MSQSIPSLVPVKNEENVVADIKVDAIGLYCPEPVMLLHKHFKRMAAGDILELNATDPSTTRDVPKFCAFLGHDLVACEQQGEQFTYLLRKGSE